MIYTIFMRKTYKDIKPFAISLVLNYYFNKLGNSSDIVIAFPGYMSNTNTTISSFLSTISFPINTYFTVGMNGRNRVKPSSTNLIQNEYNKNFNTVNGFNNINKDHAKMIYILDNPKNLTNIYVKDLLNLDVKAVLIGSSNQSYTTYCGSPANKGEADLFLINGDYIKKIDDVENKDQCIQMHFDKIKTMTDSKNKKILKNISLFKELGTNNELDLNTMFKESIQDITFSEITKKEIEN